MIKLIVALGNPGSEYEQTRHNIGWLALDHWDKYQAASSTKKFKGLYSTITTKNGKVHIIKPQTYMNLSGESVQPLAAFFKIKIDEILVVHDELDIPYGTVNFKPGGGFGGHNGLKSIGQHMAGQNFKRLRLGIAKEGFGGANYVLSKFDPEQYSVLDKYLDNVAKILDLIVNRDFATASNQYSKKSLI